MFGTGLLLKRLSVAVLPLLAGCVSNIPVEIAEAPERTVSVAEARAHPGDYAGTSVRWGGAIASVTNLEQVTLVEVVARNLDGSGRPREEDYSPGRFMARIPAFIDPAVYARQRELTVSGTLGAPQSGKIGAYDYQYPVVDVESHLLWEPRPEVEPYPYWYDPFYYPYRWHRPYRHW